MRVLAACMATLLGIGSSHAADSPPADDPAATIGIDFLHKGLLDPDAPAQARTALAAEIEQHALERKDAYLLYVVGSLYRLGREASPTSPYARDVDKAREYLTRAALKGRPGAMGKLALLELDAGNRFEANVWAQLQAHYEVEFARIRSLRDGRESPVFAVANVLALAQDGLAKEQIPMLEQRIREIIDRYDAPIRVGLERALEAQSSSPLRNARLDRCQLPRGVEQKFGRRANYVAGGAEYYVSFADDGSAGRLWLLDAWPDVRMERALRTCAGRYRVEPAEALAGKGHVALLPLVVNDARVKLSTPAAD